MTILQQNLPNLVFQHHYSRKELFIDDEGLFIMWTTFLMFFIMKNLCMCRTICTLNAHRLVLCNTQVKGRGELEGNSRANSYEMKSQTH